MIGPQPLEAGGTGVETVGDWSLWDHQGSTLGHCPVHRMISPDSQTNSSSAFPQRHLAARRFVPTTLPLITPSLPVTDVFLHLLTGLSPTAHLPLSAQRFIVLQGASRASAASSAGCSSRSVQLQSESPRSPALWASTFSHNTSLPLLGLLTQLPRGF